MAEATFVDRPQPSLWEWLPDNAAIYRDLTFKSTPQQDEEYNAQTHFKGMKMSFKSENSSAAEWFDGVGWTNWTANHWEVALAFVALYFVLIPTLRWMVARSGKWNVRNPAFYWNASLSIFSWLGVFACVPVLASSFVQHGLYVTYSVHAVMYGYFALMSTPYRKYITPYAIFITLAQLLQMLAGMFVTIKAVMYQNSGQDCNVNRTNSVLGLTMYVSYFVLFFKLFIDSYEKMARNARGSEGLLPKAKSVSQLVWSITRELTNKLMPQLDTDETAGEGTEVQDEDGKKLN